MKETFKELFLTLILAMLLCFGGVIIALMIDPDIKETDVTAAYERERLSLLYEMEKNSLYEMAWKTFGMANCRSGLDPFLLVDLCEAHEVSLTLALAQGWAESHFGSRGMAVTNNNPWNIGAYDGLESNEVPKFADMNDAIEPYLILIKNRYLPVKGWQGLVYGFTDIDGRRYSSSMTYEDTLRLLIGKFDPDGEIEYHEQMASYYRKALSDIEENIKNQRHGKNRKSEKSND